MPAQAARPVATKAHAPLPPYHGRLIARVHHAIQNGYWEKGGLGLAKLSLEARVFAGRTAEPPNSPLRKPLHDNTRLGLNIPSVS